MGQQAPEPRVAILLSTYNGARYLREQLDSLLAQSHREWTLYWRDDGSTDATVAILQDFAGRAGQGRCVHCAGPAERLRPTASFIALLRAVAPALGADDAVAFADQDDVWLPEKLARGLAALQNHLAGSRGAPAPALYCARQILVDAALHRIGLSAGLRRPAAFPAALTQNVTTGCTIMLNRAAARLVAGSRPPSATLHDWWCYLLVTAAGGAVLDDDAAVVMYRQHAGNMVGAPRSMWHRGLAALRRGPSVFMNVLRQHVRALLEQRELLSPSALAQVAAIDTALRGGWLRRAAVLRRFGLRRQTWQETGIFYVWFLIG
jgi:glycosyltransferase involved in cell wall biosynthesis